MLIDDDGRIYGRYPFLKVAVRDGNGANSGINGVIRQLLQVHGILPDEASRHIGIPTAEGTVLYTLRRDNDYDRSPEVSFQKIDDLLASMGMIPEDFPVD